MLAIKFKRIGKKHQPSYRIVINEKRSKMNGRFIEDIGWYNPFSKEFKVDKERALYRIKTGAQPTDSVYNLLVKAEIISGVKKPKHKINKKSEEKPAEAAVEKQAAPAAAETK